MAKNNFDAAEEMIKDLIDPEEIVNIDFDGLESESKTEAETLINALSRLYCDEKFLKSQPNLKTRLEADLESLRINIKMRKADELAHDILLKNIGQNPSNASMYRALTELQKTTAQLTSKIEDTVTKLSNLIKNYQMEIDFDSEEEEEIDDNEKDTFRGKKDFISAMDNLDDDDVEIPYDPEDDE